jgi:hypothetical protein
VSFETSFDSKQPKLKPKLVSALSETKCLFRLFHFYTQTESFGVSIEQKQTEDPTETKFFFSFRGHPSSRPRSYIILVLFFVDRGVLDTPFALFLYGTSVWIQTQREISCRKTVSTQHIAIC